jgi:tetratricopeptide (TPR) repeat protein
MRTTLRGFRGDSVLRLAGASFLAVALYACGASRPTGAVHSAEQPVMRDTLRALDAFVTGSIHELRGEYAEAVIDFEEAYRADPSPAIAYVLAKDYLELHRAPRAATYGDLAVAGEPTRTLYRMLRARIALELQGDFDEAERQFNGILAYDSSSVEALTQYATLMQFRGRHDRAITAYRRLFDMLGPEADIAERLAGEYAATGQFRAAIDVLQHGLRVDPGYVDLRDQLADMYLRVHAVDSATRVLEDLYARYPNDVGVRMQLARLYGTRDEWPSALNLYRRMCDDSLVDIDTLNVILDTLYARGRQCARFDLGRCR